jgi:uncharacterized membrane protein
MKKASSFETWLVCFIICIPAIYTASIYASLPDTIPIHFDMSGNPNGYAGRSSLVWIILLMAAVSFGMYQLIMNLPGIDPKKAAGQSPDVYHKIALVLVVFICAITIIIVYSIANRSIKINKLLLPIVGLLFSVLGNYMHSIKPNYFVGFRTPWTLESEDNWRKTHQLMGKIWVPGGILITIGTLLLPFKASFIFMLSVTMVMVVIPGVFSYRYYKKHQHDNNPL